MTIDNTRRTFIGQIWYNVIGIGITKNKKRCNVIIIIIYLFSDKP